MRLACAARRLDLSTERAHELDTSTVFANAKVLIDHAGNKRRDGGSRMPPERVEIDVLGGHRALLRVGPRGPRLDACVFGHRWCARGNSSLRPPRRANPGRHVS